MTNNLKLMWQDQRKQDRYTLHSQPLTDSDIHVWRASLECSHQELAELFSLLSQNERTRAERFYFKKDCHRFIAGRGFLRRILGGYLGMEPSQIEFTYGNFGKPALNSRLEDKVLEFNLSHSKDLALYIFGWNRKVGIDVEYIRSMPDIDDFAEQFFAPRESAFVNVLSGELKADAFFKIWTCKEAFLKANGNGLTRPINQVAISLEPEESVMLRSIGRDEAEAVHWHLETFNPVSGYQAALAVKRYAGQIIFQQLNNHFTL